MAKKKLPEHLTEVCKDVARDTANILWVYCPCKEDWVRTDEWYDRDVEYDDKAMKPWVEEMRCNLSTDYNVRASKKALNKTVNDSEEYLKNFKEGSEVDCEKHKEDPESPARGKELMREMTGCLKYLAIGRPEDQNEGWKNVRYFDTEGDVSISEVNCNKLEDVIRSKGPAAALKLAETLEGEREDAIMLPYEPEIGSGEAWGDKEYTQGNKRLVWGRGRVLLQQKA